MQRLLPGILAGTAAMAATLALAVLLQSGPARAGPVSGVFNIAIYHATGDGSADDAVEQATKANPMLSTPGDYVGVTTYTGPLNFNLRTGDTDTIGAFLSSGGGIYTAFNGSGDALSTAPFATTSLFVITGQGYAGEAGSVTHDDGATLYQDGKAVFSSQNPTAAISSAFRLGSNDPFQLYYIEANGLPATLNFVVPEPASFVLLGGFLLALVLLRRRQRG